jgi:hypothetical protein
MTQPTMCECRRGDFPCRHHPEGHDACGMPAKMFAWPSVADRNKDHTGDKATKLCTACAGAAVGKGWHLRSMPGTRLS